ncbi:MAG: LysR family transcriptional regulator [Pseudomonadota bacterium]
MNDWSEFKTTMIVAKLGSISAAASKLGVHRATISRHIDVVEATLGTALFVRHPRGVELTETGTEMLKVTQEIQQKFDDLKGQMRNAHGRQTGELIVTSLIGLLPQVMPAVAAFNAKFPDVTIRVLSGDEKLRLEYGEAHVAVRAGAKPTHPDYIVRKFRPEEFGAYIHRNALNRLESTTQVEDWRHLPFIGPIKANLHQPFAKWMGLHTPDAKVSVHVDAQDAVLPAVLAGVGVGFLPRHVAQQFEELVDLDPLAEDRATPVWIVTHRDLSKAAKVTEFVRLLLETIEESE